MTPNEKNRQPERKSPRLPNYDYSQNGSYFITICVQNRLSLFGQITNQEMICNDAGKMVNHHLKNISSKYDFLQPDLFVVMPNHAHLILTITGDNSVSISDIIQHFKRITTNDYINGVKKKCWRRFDRRLWQKSFHDHIIRDEASMIKIREYVKYNPRLWEKDIFYSG